MPKKQIQRDKVHSQHHHHNGQAVPPAPVMKSTHLTLQDVFVINGGPTSNEALVSVNANGVFQTSWTVPQPRIWDQFAEMYEFYQTLRIEATFLPYRFQGSGITGQGQPITVYPMYSIIDPNSTPPSATGATPSQMASFGNMKYTPAYTLHTRKMRYTDLGLSKQDKIILETNGSHTNREQYSTPATLYFNTSSPSSQGSLLDIPIGEMVFKVTYEFSGWKAPGLQTPSGSIRPQSTQWQQEATTVNEQPQTHQVITPTPCKPPVPQQPLEKKSQELRQHSQDDRNASKAPLKQYSFEEVQKLLAERDARKAVKSSQELD